MRVFVDDQEKTVTVIPCAGQKPPLERRRLEHCKSDLPVTIMKNGMKNGKTGI
jgi:hypothetical protein